MSKRCCGPCPVELLHCAMHIYTELSLTSVPDFITGRRTATDSHGACGHESHDEGDALSRRSSPCSSAKRVSADQISEEIIVVESRTTIALPSHCTGAAQHTARQLTLPALSLETLQPRKKRAEPFSWTGLQETWPRWRCSEKVTLRSRRGLRIWHSLRVLMCSRFAFRRSTYTMDV
jgi:hypothetical protein